jgi:hypothetical protein
MPTTWTSIAAATGTSWTNIAKATSGNSIPGGTPIGLLLALTYGEDTSGGVGAWTKITKASGTSWTNISKAT